MKRQGKRLSAFLGNAYRSCLRKNSFHFPKKTFDQEVDQIAAYRLVQQEIAEKERKKKEFYAAMNLRNNPKSIYPMTKDNYLEKKGWIVNKKNSHRQYLKANYYRELEKKRKARVGYDFKEEEKYE